MRLAARAVKTNLVRVTGRIRAVRVRARTRARARARARPRPRVRLRLRLRAWVHTDQKAMAAASDEAGSAWGAPG